MKLLKKQYLKKRADSRFIIYIPPDITDEDSILLRTYEFGSGRLLILGDVNKKIKVEEVDDGASSSNGNVY